MNLCRSSRLVPSVRPKNSTKKEMFFDGKNETLLNSKLLGVKVNESVLLSSSFIMLQAIPTLRNLAMKITFSFMNPLGNR